MTYGAPLGMPGMDDSESITIRCPVCDMLIELKSGIQILQCPKCDSLLEMQLDGSFKSIN